MPANGRWDLIRRLKVNIEPKIYIKCKIKLQEVVQKEEMFKVFLVVIMNNTIILNATPYNLVDKY